MKLWRERNMPQFQGHLLALCRNNMKLYAKVCDMLLDSLVVDTEESRTVNVDAVLNLAHSLKPFEKKIIEKNNLILDRGLTHFLCKEHAHLPENIDRMLGKPGVNEKKSA